MLSCGYNAVNICIREVENVEVIITSLFREVELEDPINILDVPLD